MTVIEILVVLFIVTGLIGGGTYLVGMMTHGNLKDEAMRFTSTAQYTYEQAALNNRQYRLVIDLDSQEYYTEVTESAVVMDADSDEAEAAYDDGLLPEEARARELEDDRDSDLFDDAGHDPFGVSRSTSYQRAEDAHVEPRTLDDGIEFHRVLVESRERPATSGRVAIHFFPNGLQQQAHIVFVDTSTDTKFTLVTEPLTGRIKAYSGDREIPEDFGEEEVDERF